MGATEVRPPAFDELVNSADYVVRAKVMKVDSRLEPHGGRQIIVTYTDLKVIEVVVGSPPEQVQLRQLGGKVGQREIRVDGVPEMKVGMEAVFFVQGNGLQFFPLVALMHGLYPLVESGEGESLTVTRSNGEPLRRTDEVAEPMGEHHSDAPQTDQAELPPLVSEAFIRSIRQTRKVDAEVSR